MKSFILFILICFSIICFQCKSSKPEIQWVKSNSSAQWQLSNIEGHYDKAVNEESVIEIFPGKQQQIVEGFGGCFNELGWEALQKISKEDKQQILRDLFHHEEGCKFNICRMPIGANDYAVDWYSHNETPEDFRMDNFSVSRDKQRLIPYIKEAQGINPEIQVWASPWCPPSWMKKNNHYACKSDPLVNDLSPEQSSMEELVSRFIMRPEYLQAYALYFSKFIKAYQDEGINISAVHVQNEPNSAQNFPSCVWKPKDLGIFIADYLAPQFQSDNLNTEIWLGTIERPQIERVDSVLQYKNVADIVKGVGFQWAGKGAIQKVHEKYPEMRLMQTETECGNGSNDWSAAEHTFNLMKHYFNNGANSYMYWNMVLNETGKSQWGWKQNSMISIDSQTQKVTYNPEFYLMKHFSFFVKPGFHKVVSSDPNCLAFSSMDELVIIYYNEGQTADKEFAINKMNFKATVTQKSLNTFVLEI
jgi:glucosylceramidase